MVIVRYIYATRCTHTMCEPSPALTKASISRKPDKCWDIPTHNRDRSFAGLTGELRTCVLPRRDIIYLSTLILQTDGALSAGVDGTERCVLNIFVLYEWKKLRRHGNSCVADTGGTCFGSLTVD